MTTSEPIVARCDMYHEPPFDFACCDTHDEVFPIGGVCPYYKKQVPNG